MPDEEPCQPNVKGFRVDFHKHQALMILNAIESSQESVLVELANKLELGLMRIRKAQNHMDFKKRKARSFKDMSLDEYNPDWAEETRVNEVKRNESNKTEGSGINHEPVPTETDTRGNANVDKNGETIQRTKPLGIGNENNHPKNGS